MPHRTDQELLAEMATGSREAARGCLRDLYERHADAVLSFVFRLSADMDLAEDVLQESFLVASRHAGRFQSGSARPWLLSIAARRLKDLRREHARRRHREREVAQPEITGPDLQADPELERAMAKLPPRERGVLDLRFHAGLSFAQVADVLGVSVRTAKNWSEAGLAHLRETMDMGKRSNE